MPIRRFTLIAAILLLLCASLSAATAFTQSRIEDVPFIAKCDGTTQNYVVIYPDGFDAEKPCDLLIALHGHGSDRWQFVKSDFDEARASRDAAETLTNAVFTTVPQGRTIYHRVSRGETLTGTDLKAFNTFDAPRRVVPQALPAPAPGTRMTLKLPPRSYTVVHLGL